MSGKTIGFITDLGLDDDAVGMCKGLMLRISPASCIVDVTHGVRPFDVQEAACYLADLPEYFPDDTVFCCIVFPETGTAPCIVARNERGQLFVAGDNGVLTYVLDASGFDGAWEIESHEVMLYPPTPSFWGRDVFVPCAAHLAAGVAPETVGRARASLERIKYRPPSVSGDGAVSGEITVIDKNFGNVWSNITRELFVEAGADSSGAVEVTIGEQRIVFPLVATFGEVAAGEPLAYFNSRDRFALALNRGNLAETLEPLGPLEGAGIAVTAVRVAKRAA
jgi:S-adenosylmethionine hydrolase